jgi:hypothetical protein
MKFFFFGDVADLYISPQHQRCPTHSTSGQLIYGARKRARTRDSDTYGTNSSFPHTELLRRSLLAQESFSSVVTVQSCLCSRSSSIAEREPEPFVGMRPESHRSAFCSCIHCPLDLLEGSQKARSGMERTQVVAIMDGGLHDCDCGGPG